ncbi:hypothetical protein P9314_03905 [Paenibacillus validus]|uniref:hypothetical protein n=1 Tax=Paenibacillus validus TaxID=44253 RepID=UPI001FD44B00|nr:hypothetical protein [Paenibacillus validus]MED4599851.1 hypothetical protein [Paenibacillus validus]MED4606116.1 hypothetical protein [Paenibacillus validus]
MRNKRNVLIAMILFLFVIGCQANKTEIQSTNATSTVNSQASSNETEGNQKIDVDKGLLNVEVTLPASFFKDQDVDKAIEKAKSEGVKEAKKNPDGSVTYIISKSKHAEIIKGMEESVSQTVNDLKSGKNFKSIKDVSHNKDYSEFTMTVDKNAFEKSLDGFSLLGISMSAMYYQLFDGVSNDKIKVTIQLKDETTNNIFKTIVYPDALENMKQ